MAKAESVELTEEQAEKAFAEFNKTGELSDEELDNVSGGGCGDPETPGEPKFNVGGRIYYLVTKPAGPRAYPVQEKVFSTVTGVGKSADVGYVYRLSNGETKDENSLSTLSIQSIVVTSPRLTQSRGGWSPLAFLLRMSISLNGRRPFLCSVRAFKSLKKDWMTS